ncbi:MAG: hypothetical protein K2I03_12150 [Lachnospiraceae bacterium]|nr:hypothetical protein [Lachnospiraceae bacterium]
METFYLIDFVNVHNEGMESIGTLTETDHVHIFYTENALNISLDIVLTKGIDIIGHKVPVRKQSLDMHLVSYLGYLLGINKGKECSYVIISKDKDYDNIIKFWQENGFKSISRNCKILSSNVVNQQKITASLTANVTQAVNSKINAGMAYEFSGNDRSQLNLYMQHGLTNLGYSIYAANRICKYVVAHCNDEHMLNGIHNDLRREFEDYSKVYEDVKVILQGFVSSKSKVAKRESQVRSFFGQHFKKKIYIDKKEEIIQIILGATARQQVNNELLKLYSNSSRVKEMIKTLQPLIKELPGR